MNGALQIDRLRCRLGYHRWGFDHGGGVRNTSRGINNHSGKGIFPARNWTATGAFAPLEKLGFEARLPQKVGQTSCAGCPVGCGQLNIARTDDYAGILAVQILALADDDLAARLEAFKKDMAVKVEEKAKKLENSI